MDTLKLYTIAKRIYYSTDNLIILNMDILKGCKNGRRIIDEKKLCTSDYVHAKFYNKKWIDDKLAEDESEEDNEDENVDF